MFQSDDCLRECFRRCQWTKAVLSQGRVAVALRGSAISQKSSIEEPEEAEYGDVRFMKKSDTEL